MRGTLNSALDVENIEGPSIYKPKRSPTLKIAKCTVLTAAIALALIAWLAGCKEVVAPIQPVQLLHDHDQQAEEETRRSRPAPPEPPREPPRSPFLRGTPDTIDEAVESLHSSDPLKRRTGVESFCLLLTEGTAAKRQEALKTLREVLLHALDGDDTDLVTAVLSVFKISPGNPSVVRIFRALLDHPIHEVRNAAAEAFVGMYDSTGDIEGLASLLGVYDHDFSARAAICLTVKGRETVPVLVRVLKTSPNPNQRHGAAMVLAMICGGRSPKQQEFAQLALATQHDYLKREAKLPDPRALQPLIDALLHDNSKMVREIAAQGLGYFGTHRAAAALAEALINDSAESVRRRAAAALITVPARPVRPALEKALLTDESDQVRRYVAEALGWIGEPTAVGALVKATDDESAEVRRYAAAQLGKLAKEAKLPEQLHDEGLGALVELFDDGNADVRWAAVVAVGELRDRAAVSMLVNALDDPVTMVSHAAERALQKLGVAERKAEEFEKQDAS